MSAPGIKSIRQVELATKWRPLVPYQYQDNICPIPSREITVAFKEFNKSTAEQKTKKALSTIKKMKKSKIQDELKKGQYARMD